MTKTFSLLFLFMFLASCGGSSGGSGNAAAPQTQSAPQQDAIASTEAMTFETHAKLVGFNASQEDKVLKALELIKKVVASDSFKSKVLNFKYNGKNSFVDNRGYSNSQIYQKILDGAEKMGDTSKNNTMDVEVELYLDNNSIALGYTLPNVTRIWLNKKYFGNFEPYEVAGNLFHEWLHKLGFGHAVSNNPSRPSSVPYAIGYILRDMAKTMD